MIATDDRLWALAGTEVSYESAIEAYECQIEWQDGEGPWILEEWDLGDPWRFVPSVDMIINWMVEAFAEGVALSDDGADDLMDDPEIIASAAVLRDTFARKAPGPFPGKVVGRHEVTVTTREDGGVTVKMGEEILAQHPASRPSGPSVW